MEIGLLYPNSLEECSDANERGEGRANVAQGSPHLTMEPFVSRVSHGGGGQGVLGTHFGKYCSRRYGSESIRSPGKHTQIFTRVKFLTGLLERSNSVLKNGLKIKICAAFKSPTLCQSHTAP